MELAKVCRIRDNIALTEIKESGKISIESNRKGLSGTREWFEKEK